MDTNLRCAVATDLDAVMALENAGFVPGIVEDAPVFARRIAAFPEGFLLAGAPPWGYWCAEIWDGFGGVEPGDLARFDLGHDIGTWHRSHGDTLYIASMTVAPGARGAGRGRLLFRTCVTRMAEAFPRLRKAVLIVNEHWPGARAIYLSEGFVETGRVPAFFRPHAGPIGDAVVMERAIVREN